MCFCLQLFLHCSSLVWKKKKKQSPILTLLPFHRSKVRTRLSVCGWDCFDRSQWKWKNWMEKCELRTIYTPACVCVCVLVLMKDKHSSWKSRCSPSWKVCDNLKRGCLISWERQRASGNSWPQSEWSHTPTGFGVFVWGCVCVWVEFCVSICSCLHVNVDVCWCVCVCVCFLGSWTNKGRGPVDEPIKEQEEWEEDTPTQHALPITQIRDGKWSKNNQDVMKLFRAFRFGW